MIVEDEPSLRMMLSAAMMLIWGVEPLAFHDGYDAMAWLDGVEAQKTSTMLPELALLDIRMPGPQGPEIAERLRKVPATSKMAIVMMTAYRLNSEERESIVKMAKPQAMVSKPLPRLTDLKQTLELAIDRTRSGILGPIELSAVSDESQQEPGIPKIPSLEELTAPPKGLQQEPGAPSPQQTTGPAGSQQGPGAPSPETVLKGSHQGPGAPGAPGPQQAAGPTGSQQGPGAPSPETVLKGSQQEPGAPDVPSPQQTTTPAGSQQGLGAPSPKESTAAPEKPQHEPGTPSPKEPAAAPERPRHGSGALGTRELTIEPKESQHGSGTPSPRSGGQA